MRLCQLTTIAAIAILSATPANSEPTQNPEIACETQPGYILCEARSAELGLDYSWSTTGNLAINVASGPLVSIRCEEGDTGQLLLNQDAHDSVARSCVQIACGTDAVAQACRAASSAGQGAASSP
jgi:hypothetical protein